MKDKLTDLCGNSLLQNNFINTFREINLEGRADGVVAVGVEAVHIDRRAFESQLLHTIVNLLLTITD